METPNQTFCFKNVSSTHGYIARRLLRHVAHTIIPRPQLSQSDQFSIETQRILHALYKEPSNSDETSKESIQCSVTYGEKQQTIKVPSTQPLYLAFTPNARQYSSTTVHITSTRQLQGCRFSFTLPSTQQLLVQLANYQQLYELPTISGCISSMAHHPNVLHKNAAIAFLSSLGILPFNVRIQESQDASEQVFTHENLDITITFRDTCQSIVPSQSNLNTSKTLFLGKHNSFFVRIPNDTDTDIELTGNDAQKTILALGNESTSCLQKEFLIEIRLPVSQTASSLIVELPKNSQESTSWQLCYHWSGIYTSPKSDTVTSLRSQLPGQVLDKLITGIASNTMPSNGVLQAVRQLTRDCLTSPLSSRTHIHDITASYKGDFNLKEQKAKPGQFLLPTITPAPVISNDGKSVNVATESGCAIKILPDATYQKLSFKLQIAEATNDFTIGLTNKLDGSGIWGINTIGTYIMNDVKYDTHEQLKVAKEFEFTMYIDRIHGLARLSLPNMNNTYSHIAFMAPFSSSQSYQALASYKNDLEPLDNAKVWISSKEALDITLQEVPQLCLTENCSHQEKSMLVEALQYWPCKRTISNIISTMEYMHKIRYLSILDVLQQQAIAKGLSIPDQSAPSQTCNWWSIPCLQHAETARHGYYCQQNNNLMSDLQSWAQFTRHDTTNKTHQDTNTIKHHSLCVIPVLDEMFSDYPAQCLTLSSGRDFIYGHTSAATSNGNTPTTMPRTIIPGSLVGSVQIPLERKYATFACSLSLFSGHVQNAVLSRIVTATARNYHQSLISHCPQYTRAWQSALELAEPLQPGAQLPASRTSRNERLEQSDISAGYIADDLFNDSNCLVYVQILFDGVCRWRSGLLRSIHDIFHVHLDVAGIDQIQIEARILTTKIEDLADGKSNAIPIHPTVPSPYALVTLHDISLSCVDAWRCIRCQTWNTYEKNQCSLQICRWPRPTNLKPTGMSDVSHIHTRFGVQQRTFDQSELKSNQSGSKTNQSRSQTDQSESNKNQLESQDDQSESNTNHSEPNDQPESNTNQSKSNDNLESAVSFADIAETFLASMLILQREGYSILQKHQVDSLLKHVLKTIHDDTFVQLSQRNQQSLLLLLTALLTYNIRGQYKISGEIRDKCTQTIQQQSLGHTVQQQSLDETDLGVSNQATNPASPSASSASAAAFSSSSASNTTRSQHKLNASQDNTQIQKTTETNMKNPRSKSIKSFLREFPLTSIHLLDAMLLLPHPSDRLVQECKLFDASFLNTLLQQRMSMVLQLQQEATNCDSRIFVAQVPLLDPMTTNDTLQERIQHIFDVEPSKFGLMPTNDHMTQSNIGVAERIAVYVSSFCKKVGAITEILMAWPHVVNIIIVLPTTLNSPVENLTEWVRHAMKTTLGGEHHDNIQLQTFMCLSKYFTVDYLLQLQTITSHRPRLIQIATEDQRLSNTIKHVKTVLYATHPK